MNIGDLKNLYTSEPEIYEKWHIKAGEGLEVCTQDTWDIIKDHDKYLYNFGYFSIVRTPGDLPRLGGFFIKPEFRNEETKSLFIQEVYSKMPKIFASALHNKNTRAIKFLKKLPGLQIVTTKDMYTFFIFKQGSL